MLVILADTSTFFGSPEVERFSIALNLSDIVDFCTKKNIFYQKKQILNHIFY